MIVRLDKLFHILFLIVYFLDYKKSSPQTDVT